ncbi:hypothetical protein E2562_008521 [Oryza meyeriana var. granulata]|uniref:Uncharacterized protein n=1 Tax=Oryza meyeriana var. granulata TaxID=110450 RepID=A0A6G1C4S6_9ORYZ|nr:hypothetical protein E2562_008521 [Oryza meyeriana var. granulata]
MCCSRSKQMMSGTASTMHVVPRIHAAFPVLRSSFPVAAAAFPAYSVATFSANSTAVKAMPPAAATGHQLQPERLHEDMKQMMKSLSKEEYSGVTFHKYCVRWKERMEQFSARRMIVK